MPTVDSRLRRWVIEALELGFGCFTDGDSAPFFIILSAAGKSNLCELKSADGVIDAKLVESGRSIIRELAQSAQYYVLVWDGYLTIAGKRQEAVFGESGAAGEETAFLFAQRYRQLKSQAHVKVGRPLVVAEVPHLWREAHAKPQLVSLGKTRSNLPKDSSASTFTMNIKREFFAAILSQPRRKAVEYRDLTDYWLNRLDRVGPAPFNLRLLNGMSPPVPEATVRVEKVVIDKRSKTIELHLGRVIEVVHWDRKSEQPC